MALWEWLKSKAGWIAAGLGVVIAALVAGSMSKSGIKAALALKQLTDAAKSHDAAQKKADELKKKTDALAEALLTEELLLAAQKEKAGALSPSDVIADLKRRGLLK